MGADEDQPLDARIGEQAPPQERRPVGLEQTLGQHHADIGHHRLGQHAGQLIAMALDEYLDRVDIVERVGRELEIERGVLGRGLVRDGVGDRRGVVADDQLLAEAHALAREYAEAPTVAWF